MRWVVTFLDILVLLWILFGFANWRNAFPEYLRYDTVHEISGDGLNVVLLIKKDCSLLNCILWLRPPDDVYNIAYKKQEDFFYRFLNEKPIGEYGSSLDAAPPVWPLRTSNGYNYIAIKEKEYSFSPELYLYELSRDGGDSAVSVLRITAFEDSSEIKELSDEALLTGETLAHEHKTFCKIHDPRRVNFLGQFEQEEYLRQEGNFKSVLNEPGRFRALYEAFGLLGLKSNCLDSLSEYFGLKKESLNL